MLFRGKRLFPRTSWAIAPGEHWAILGPNGSGKSALALALRGALPVADGELLLPSPKALAHVSFDDQRELVVRWSPYLQGRYESLGVDGAPRARDFLGRLGSRHRSLVDRLALGGLLERKLPHLSNGEARKLLIARALLARPRLLILEEPLLGLDRESRAELRRIVREVARLGVTLLLVASRPEDVIAPVRRVLYVREGRIVGRGSRRTLLAARLAGAARARAAPPARRSRPLPPLPAELLAARRRPSAGPPIVELRAVTVEHEGVRVLDRVCWTIRAGENWALVGPNGAGKTTLLSLVLADHPQAYANDVRFLGQPRGEGVTIWEIKAACGHVSPELQIQDAGGASVLEVILSGFFDSVGLHGTPSTRQRRLARSWARALGLTALLGRPFTSLSEGERRLALIARALVKRPRLLVLDEPCQGLDAAHRGRVLEIVERIGRARSCALVYVSHDPRELPACLDRVLRLQRGRRVGSGRRARPRAKRR